MVAPGEVEEAVGAIAVDVRPAEIEAGGGTYYLDLGDEVGRRGVARDELIGFFPALETDVDLFEAVELPAGERVAMEPDEHAASGPSRGR